MKISAIAAQSLNGVIGNGGSIPWDLPTDRAFYRGKTHGRVVVMGRRTFESMREPLPYRRTIVLTRDRAFRADGAEIFHNVSDVVDALRESVPADEEVFVIGGERPYTDFLPRVSDVYLTIVDAALDGDTFFPRLPGAWNVRLLEEHVEPPRDHNLHGTWYPHRMYHVARTL